MFKSRRSLFVAHRSFAILLCQQLADIQVYSSPNSRMKQALSPPLIAAVMMLIGVTSATGQLIIQCTDLYIMVKLSVDLKPRYQC